MNEPRNRAVLLAARPRREVTNECFELRETDIPQLHEGDVMVRNIYLSCDPYMRGQLGDGGYKSAFGLGEVIPARTVGEVVESKDPRFTTGQFVWGFMGWELYSVARGTDLRPVDPRLGPLSHAISVLGMPGLTAHIGVQICTPSAGETFYVSAASGAVGQVAGQLAKQNGCRVVGSAGSQTKIDFLVSELGFDAAFNYREVSSLTGALDEHCPQGVDAYFDNVGGATLDAVLARLNDHARIAVCGQISQYDNETDPEPLFNARAILGTRSSITGFSVRDNMHQFDTVIPKLAALMQRGVLRYVEDIIDGIDNTPAAFIGMMAGDNLGKRLVRVGIDPLLSG